MRFHQTALPGVHVVEATPHEDERGLFARTFDAGIFRAEGLADSWPQCSVSFNHKAGTLRGLHYQAEPSPEAKLVRCTRGRIFDVALDLRPASPTFRLWHGEELSAENRKALFIPAGCAHGFITLEDASEIFYQINEAFVPALARGVRWNDPAFSIRWPREPSIMSDRDAAYPDFAA
jgi:dTDP-4-dehydrorhamnose 3,5-epimerase